MAPLPRTVVVGQGYVGLPLAITAAEHGFSVTGVEADHHRLASLQAARSYVEAVSDERLRAVTASGLYRCAEAISPLTEFDVAVISVPTPLDDDGRPDLRFVLDAARLVGQSLRQSGLVILESTSFPGTTEDVLVPALEQSSGLREGSDFDVAFSPERIDPGNDIWLLDNTPKLVAGTTDAATARAQAFYAEFVDTVVPMSGTREAELAKLIENAFRYVSIAMVNEVSAVFGSAGIDVAESLRGAATKPFGYLPFWPGPGVGGHCLPVDIAYLSWYAEHVLGQRLTIAEASAAVNSTAPQRVADHVESRLAEDGLGVAGAEVVILGLAYKPDIGDIRHSPALDIAHELLRRGAVVSAVDPHVDPESPYVAAVKVVVADEATLRNADAVVLVVDHAAFDADQIATSTLRFIDVRRGVPAPSIKPGWHSPPTGVRSRSIDVDDLAV